MSATSPQSGDPARPSDPIRPSGRWEPSEAIQSGEWREIGPPRPPAAAVPHSAPGAAPDPYGEARPVSAPETPPDPTRASSGTPSPASRRTVRWNRRRAGPLALAGLVIGLVALVAALVALDRAQQATKEARARCAALARALEATPGLVVLAAEADAGGLRVRGLADPAARSPREVAAAIVPNQEIARVALDFVPYEAEGAEFTAARLRRCLAPPPGVDVDVDASGVARLVGEAPAAWIDSARAVAPAVRGVASVDLAQLVDVDRRELERAVAALEGQTVRFPLGRADLGGATDLADPRNGAAAARAGIAAVADAAARAGVFVRVELVPERHDLEAPFELGLGLDLALRRLAAVRALLRGDAGAWLLFEARPLPGDGTLDGDGRAGGGAGRGAVRLELEILGRGARGAGLLGSGDAGAVQSVRGGWPADDGARAGRE